MELQVMNIIKMIQKADPDALKEAFEEICDGETSGSISINLPDGAVTHGIEIEASWHIQDSASIGFASIKFELLVDETRELESAFLADEEQLA
jgi:hypothetical protein